MKLNRKQLTFVLSDAKSNGYTHFQIPKSSDDDHSMSERSASILFHAAIHPWIKLHPQYEVGKPILLQVGEGCCQLLAMFFLQIMVNPS
jgi:hypothetical protein